MNEMEDMHEGMHGDSVDHESNYTPPVQEEPKLATWKNAPTLSDLKADLDAARSHHAAHVADVSDWIDQFNCEGKHAPIKRKGYSSVQPKIIRKQIEWRAAGLIEPLLSDLNLFKVRPRTYADIQAAFENGLVLNYQFQNQLDKVNFLDTYVRTAITEGTAIVKVAWKYEERKEKTKGRILKAVPATSVKDVQMLQQAIEMEQASPEHFAKLDPMLKASVDASIERGEPVIVEDGGEQDVEIVKVIHNKPDLTVCDYRNVIIDPTCGNEFEKANFLVHSFEASKSDLERAGIYTNIDKIVIEENTESASHHVKGDTSFRFQDEPRKKFTVYEYWGYWDIDDSGITVPIVAAWVGDTMIRLEHNPYPDHAIPFVVVPYLPVKDSVYGEPDAVLLEDHQKLIGALTRGMVDSMARSANAQRGIRKDMLDPIQRRKFENGDDYEFNPTTDPRQGLIEHQFPELPASTFNMLMMLNNDVDALSGIKSFTDGMSGSSLGNTASGITGVLTAQSKREISILNRISSGLVKIARKVLAMNGEFLADEEVIRITDEDMVNINRENLKGMFDVTMSINTADTDNMKAQELAFMLQTMGQTLPFDITKIILADIAELRKMPDLAKSLRTYAPEPDPVQQMQQQMAMQKLQLENQKLAMEIQEIQATIGKIAGQTMNFQGNAAAHNAKVQNIQANTAKIVQEIQDQASGTQHQRMLEQARAATEAATKRDILGKALDHKLAMDQMSNVQKLQELQSQRLTQGQ